MQECVYVTRVGFIDEISIGSDSKTVVVNCVQCNLSTMIYTQQESIWVLAVKARLLPALQR